MTSTDIEATEPGDEISADDLTDDPREDVEALCLCALLWTTPDTAARIVDTLTTADFYRPIYAELYDVIATLVRSGAPTRPRWWRSSSSRTAASAATTAAG